MLAGEGGRSLDAAGLVELYAELAGKYPLVSIEDGLDQDDWSGWKALTDRLGGNVQLVGDDLFVTQTARLKRGIEQGIANSILVKVNQIGTLSETLDAVRTAQHSRYTAIIGAFFFPITSTRHSDTSAAGSAASTRFS